MRLIDISESTQSLNQDVCDALLGLHAFTGCDSMSAFLGKGKKRAVKIIQKCPQVHKQLMQSLGTSWNVDDDWMLVKNLFVFFMVLITMMSMMFAVSYFRQKEPNHVCFLSQGMRYTNTCFVEIIRLESGEMQLKEWQKFQLHTGMDGY